MSFRILWHRLRPALRELALHKARTALVLFGVAISAAAMIFIASLVNISGRMVQSEVLGTLTIAGEKKAIPNRIVSRIKDDFKWVDAVMPVLFIPFPPNRIETEGVSRPRNALAGVVALDPELFKYGYFKNREAASFDASDDGPTPVLITPGVAEKLFPGGLPKGLAAVSIQSLGKTNSPPLKARVTGVIKPFIFDEIIEANFTWEPDMIFMPIDYYQDAVYGSQGVNMAFVRTKEPQNARDNASDLRRLMNRTMPDAPPRVVHFASIVEEAEQAAKRMLIVASVYVALIFISTGATLMNVMFISVAQRTREIGIRRAAGARKADIFWQFLFETILLGFAGVAIGAALGLAGAAHVWLNVLENPSLTFPILRTAAYMLFAGAACIVFGLTPSLRAAALNPVVAIKVER